MDLKDKFIGTILGVAIGDALGAPVEGLSPQEIKTRYGKITDYIQNDEKDLKKGEWTDDTAMTIAILEALVENAFFDVHSIIEKFLKWFNGNPKGIGNTTFNALYLIDQGYSYDEASRMVQTQFSAGNGAAMRVAPIPLFNYKNEIEKLIQDTIDASFITHSHPKAISGAVATSLVIYHNLHYSDKNKLINFLLNDAKEFINDKEFLNIIAEMSNFKETDLINHGYIVQTFKSSLWIFLNSDDFETAILRAVNLGYDADTVGAITGAFAGSYYGRKNIPEKFIKNLKKYDYIIKLTEKLYEIAIEDKIYDF